MSGGSMDYFYFKLEEYAKDLEDVELVDLALDFAQLFHDKEWYDSGDTGEGDWNLSVENFKNKWFKADRTVRVQEYIDKACNDLKKTLTMSFGKTEYCGDCKFYEPCGENDNYGDCKFKPYTLQHFKESVCENYIKKENQ